MFNKKKKRETITYNAELEQPAVKTSICTGEKVAGFIDIDTGKLHDYMLIKGSQDLVEFCDNCNVQIDDLKKIVKEKYKENPEYIDLNSYDVSNLTDLSYVFAGCKEQYCLLLGTRI